MRTRLKHAIVAGATIALVAPLGVALVAQGASAAPVLLSAGKPATASSSNQTYVAGNVTDGNQASYWESVNNAFPQWVQVDLGAAATVTDITLKIPGGWGARNETVTLQGSTDGSSFTTLKASASYAFTGGNAVAVDVTDTSARYVRAAVSANTGWPAAQLSEVEVYGDLVDTRRSTRPKAATSRRVGRSPRPPCSRRTSPATRSTAPPPPTGRVRRARTRRTSRCRSPRSPRSPGSSSSSTPTPRGATARRRSRSRAARAAARGAPSRRPRPTCSARRPATR